MTPTCESSLPGLLKFTPPELSAAGVGSTGFDKDAVIIESRSLAPKSSLKPGRFGIPHAVVVNQRARAAAAAYAATAPRDSAIVSDDAHWPRHGQRRPKC